MKPNNYLVFPSLIFTLLLSLSSCGQRAKNDASVQRFAYGTAVSQVGDLRLPSGSAAAPVVVIVHGGCWQERGAGLTHTEALAEALRRAGFATWNVEYRRLGETGGGWPGTFQDVGAALDFVRDLNQRVPGRLDTTRVVVVGHSAGGHLASWLAIRRQLPPDWANGAKATKSPFQPTGIVNLDGPPDLLAFERADGLYCGPGIIAQLLGGTPESQPQRWRWASPVEFLPWRVPTWLVVGTEGMMPDALNQQFLARAVAAGDTATHLLTLPKANHFALVDPTSAAWPAVLRTVRAASGGPHSGASSQPAAPPARR